MCLCTPHSQKPKASPQQRVCREGLGTYLVWLSSSGVYVVLQAAAAFIDGYLRPAAIRESFFLVQKKRAAHVVNACCADPICGPWPPLVSSFDEELGVTLVEL